MNLIPPIEILDAMVNDTNIAEPSASEAADEAYAGIWNVGVTYTMNEKVIYEPAHKIYQSLKNDNVGVIPGGTGNETWWLEISYTERWMPFDAKVGSQVEQTSIMYELDIDEPVDSVAILNFEADTVNVYFVDQGATGATITWTPVVYDVDMGLYISDVVKTDFPLTYLTPRIRVELSKISGDALLGEIVVGPKKSLGKTKFSPSVGIIDYSIKEVDDFGNYVVLERAYSKRLSCSTNLLNSSLDLTYNTLAEFRARPAVWIGSEDYASMIVYGFYRDFTIDLAYLKYSVCTLEIEGLV